MSEPLTPAEILAIVERFVDGTDTADDLGELLAATRRLLYERDALEQEVANWKAEHEVTMAFYRDEVRQLESMRAERDALARELAHTAEHVDSLRLGRNELEAANAEAEGKRQTLELQLEQFNADNLDLRAQLETVTSDYATDQDAYLDAQNQIAAIRARCEQLTEDFRTPEPCGHMKNFAIGDEHGHFSCTVCRCEQLVKQNREEESEWVHKWAKAADAHVALRKRCEQLERANLELLAKVK